MHKPSRRKVRKLYKEFKKVTVGEKKPSVPQRLHELLKDTSTTLSDREPSNHLSHGKKNILEGVFFHPFNKQEKGRKINNNSFGYGWSFNSNRFYFNNAQ